MDKFNIFLNQICNCYDSMLILCDFNLPKIPRDSPCNPSGVSEESFVDLLKDHFLTQTNKLPMRENTVLDLIISSNPQSVTTTEVLSAQNVGIFTDHNILSFDLMATVKAPTNIHIQSRLAGLRHALNAINLSSQSTARANKLLGFVKRSTRHKQSTIVRRSVYLTIVRPHLGYTTQVWAPHITHALHYRMILFG